MTGRRASCLAMAVAVLGVAAHAGCASRLGRPPLPPLNDPAVAEHLPGKFVWADLFTNELPAARRFYAELFGWEWRPVSEGRRGRYGILHRDGEAIAGIAHLDPPDVEGPYARWIHYLSVSDVTVAMEGAVEHGGRSLLPAREVAERGEFAVLADPEDAPFGVLHSSSGDPPDFRAEVGEWLWIGLFARDAQAAARFYGSTFGYDVYERGDHSEVLDFVLAQSGYSRAGVAQLGPTSEAKPIWLGYVRVDDLAGSLEKAASLGGKVLYAPEDGELAGVLAIVEDPFGTPIGLMRWDPDEAAASDAEAAP